MQKQKFKYFFKMAAIAAILDFGPSPKSNGMILGPYLTPHQVSSKSVEEFFRNTVHKQTDRGENSNLRPSSMAEVNSNLSQTRYMAWTWMEAHGSYPSLQCIPHRPGI